jgi:alpha-glucosidase
MLLIGYSRPLADGDKSIGGFVKHFYLAALAALSVTPALAASLPATLKSPDGRISVTLTHQGALNYAIERKGESIINQSALRVRLAEGEISYGAVGEVSTRSVNETRQLVATKAAQARDHFNEITVVMKPSSGTPREFRWIFRAYDDGVAFRYVVPADAGLKTLSVRNEETEFGFAADFGCHGFNVARYDSSHEGEFDPVQSSLLREHGFYDLPLVCRTGRNAFAITESNLVDYGGLYLRGRGDGKLGVQPRLSPRLDDRTLVARAEIGANGAGSPWRVIMLGDSLGKLIESHLVGNLNPDPSFDTSWIRAGKTAWDWWSGPYLPPPDKGGTDMPTIKKYIDFAGRSGFEYMMIDEGWCLRSGVGGSAPADADITRAKPEIDMPALVAYGARKKVGLWLWVQWSLLDRQMDEALAQYASWGIKGIKVDFMDRNDRPNTS